MSKQAQKVVLDALQDQVEFRVKNNKYDAAQRELIHLLIPAKIKEYREKGLTNDDLIVFSTLYDLIEQPNGLRASYTGATKIPSGTLIETNNSGKTATIIGTEKNRK